MKLQKVISLCKKEKVMRLYDRLMDAEYADDGTLAEGCEPYMEQYISDGGAVYPLEGLPELDFDTLFTLYDISESDAEKIMFNRSAFPEGVDIGDVVDGEQQLEKPNIAISAGGADLLPFQTSGGMVFINAKYMGPLADDLDLLEVHERRTPDGQVYLAAKVGMQNRGKGNCAPGKEVTAFVEAWLAEVVERYDFAKRQFKKKRKKTAA